MTVGVEDTDHGHQVRMFYDVDPKEFKYMYQDCKILLKAGDHTV